MSPAEAIAPVLFFLAIAWGIWRSLARNRTATLVLQKFSIAIEPQSMPNPTVEIIGRTQGVVAFVLTLLGFSPITRFTIAGPELRCQSSSLFGQRSQFIPLRCVSTMAAGIHKPIAALVWAALFLVLGGDMSFAMSSWAPIAIALVFGIIFVVMYVLTKKFFIEVYPQGGPPISLLFKPNVIEGVPIDVDQALSVIGVIRDMILNDGAPTQPPRPARLVQQNEIHAVATDDAPLWASQPEEAQIDEEEQAKQMFATARQHAHDGHKQHAVSTLQEIVRRFPHTQTADQARRNLQKSGIPT